MPENLQVATFLKLINATKHGFEIYQSPLRFLQFKTKNYKLLGMACSFETQISQLGQQRTNLSSKRLFEET